MFYKNDDNGKNEYKNDNDDKNESSSNEEDVKGITKQQLEQIEKVGSVTPVNGKHIIHCLTIVGEIEGHVELPSGTKATRYEHVIPQLVAIEQDSNVEGMLVILNTVGGDVEAGLALAELISGMKKATVSLVLGGGHSIGVPLAVSADYSFIVPSATMTIHPVRTSGLVLGVPQTLNYFEKMQERITGFITSNSKISAEKLRTLMLNTGEMATDMGTVLCGKQAVDAGIINEVGSLSDAVNKLYNLIEKKDSTKDKTK